MLAVNPNNIKPVPATVLISKCFISRYLLALYDALGSSRASCRKDYFPLRTVIKS
jgi:hypothetical protein